MPKGRSTTVRLYNLAKKKEQQRMKSNDPGQRKGSNKRPLQLMKEIGRETKRKAKESRPKSPKTRKR